MATPSVFISYSWDNETHKAWVLNLANQLVANGIDVKLDQYDLKLGRNLTHYMEHAVENVDKVVMIFTENYKLKAEGRTGGVGYEYSMINSEWYKEQTDNVKFIPILRSGTDKTAIPIFVRSYTYGDMRNDENFEKSLKELLRTIYDSPAITRPPIGPKPDFLSKNERTNPERSKPSGDHNVGPIEQSIDFQNDIHAFKKKLHALMDEDEVKEVLNLMKQFADKKRDNSLQNDLTLISGRFNRTSRSMRNGLLTSEQANIQQNQINQAILSIIDSL